MDREPSEAGTTRELERLAARFIEAGMPRMASRVFVVVLASDDGALTAAEIGERLGVSPAAVSKAVQYLTSVHLLHREYVPGSRRDRYALGNDLWSELFSFRTQWVQRVAASADEAIAALGDQAGAVAHLVELRDMCQFLEKEMADMEQRWRSRDQG